MDIKLFTLMLLLLCSSIGFLFIVIGFQELGHFSLISGFVFVACIGIERFFCRF